MRNGVVIKEWQLDNETASENLNEILLLLTALANYRVFIYSCHQAWFMPFGTKDKEAETRDSIWGQEGYFFSGFGSNIDGFSEVETKQIRLVEPTLYFNRYGRCMDQHFDLPHNFSLLLDIYYSLPADAKRIFLSACSLINQGRKIWSEHPSLSFAAFVSALETLIVYDHRNETVEKCSECQQDRYRVVKKFRSFFTAYGSPSPEYKKYAAKVYQYRSKILHRGELFLGELEPRKFASRDGIEDDQLRRGIIRTCRICLVNWLTQQASVGPAA